MWVRKAIHEAGIVTREIGILHAIPAEAPVPGRFRFAFVRHPAEWYRSFWAYRMREGWTEDSLLDTKCRSDRFGRFMESALRYCPGYVSQLYELFVGPPWAPAVEFIGRQESLAYDLVRALRAAGELFDEVKLRAVPPVNTDARLPVWPRGLLKEVTRAEERAMERFGYG